MARSKIYGGGGLTGQFLRDTAFSDEIGPGKYINRGLQTKSAPPPSDQITPTFLASLVSDTEATSHGNTPVTATESRNSDASYVQRDVLYTANENQIRQERLGVDGSTALGTLMEPAITNKCANYNAIANPSLHNMSLSGNPSATLTVVNDAEEITKAGLNVIAAGGKAYLLDNRSGTGTGQVSIGGIAGNLNAHTLSVFWRSPEGGNARLKLSNAENPAVTPPTSYIRHTERLTPGNANDTLIVSAFSPMRIYFILNQLEEAPVVSSPIVTRGVAASRAIDQLSWPTVDSQSRQIINQAQGMIAVLWRPQFSLNDISSTQSQRILSSTTAILFFSYQGANGAFAARSGTITDEVSGLAAPLSSAKEYLVVMRWNGSSFQGGHKVDGAWVWSTGGNFTSIQDSGNLVASEFGTGGIDMGIHAKNLYVWSEDKGTAWLESFFSGVAN